MDITRLKRGWLGGRTTLNVTSPFGWRFHPIQKKRKKHYGIDISVPVGTPIYAPVSGSISCRFQQGKAGLYVTITSGGFVYMFMHLSRATLSEGSSGSIREGQILGYSGGARGQRNSGSSTGPHLHFEIRRSPGSSSASAVNPIYFISDKLIGKVRQNLMASEQTIVPIVGEISGEPDVLPAKSISESTIEKDRQTDISDQVDENETEDDEIIEADLEEGLATGIWQIVKLALDGNVANLRIHDAATSVQSGSILGFFNKMCQQPFVEFFGDTYGDQYYFIARRPPFDREGMLKTLVTQGLFKTSVKPTAQVDMNYDRSSPYEIAENSIINSSLSFNTQGIYSWYQFYPIYEMGAPNDLQYIIPAIFFPEYASIWGSRDFSVRSQYRNFTSPAILDDLKKQGKSLQGDSEVRHSVHDLKYIIECNAYNPFVRNGTITLMGNRRIKRGVFVRICWSNFNEIFYVESVSQSYNVTTGGVNRTTTLTLSHGMVEDYMFSDTRANAKVNKAGRDESDVISYFNIINFGDYEDKRENLTMDDWPELISKWKVNTDVFMFFLKKMQLISNLVGITTVGSNVED